jgi:hypothetical protein
VNLKRGAAVVPPGVLGELQAQGRHRQCQELLLVSWKKITEPMLGCDYVSLRESSCISVAVSLIFKFFLVPISQ